MRWKECGKRFTKEALRVYVGIKVGFNRESWGEEKPKQTQLSSRVFSLASMRP